MAAVDCFGAMCDCYHGARCEGDCVPAAADIGGPHGDGDESVDSIPG